MVQDMRLWIVCDQGIIISLIYLLIAIQSELCRRLNLSCHLKIEVEMQSGSRPFTNFIHQIKVYHDSFKVLSIGGIQDPRLIGRRFTIESSLSFVKDKDSSSLHKESSL